MVYQSCPSASPESKTGRMWGCCSRAAQFDLPQKTPGSQHRRDAGVEHFERDRPIVLYVMGEIDGRHAAAAELAVDQVSIAEDAGQR